MNYEAKQHKQGIKTADQILKKFPNHGGMLHRPAACATDRELMLNYV